MEKKNQWNTGYWIVALLLLLSLQSYWQTAKTVEPVPYSEFEKALDEGRVAEVLVSDRTVTGRLKSPDSRGKTTIVATRVEPDLADRLSKYDVPYARVLGEHLAERCAVVDPASGILLWRLVLPVPPLRREAGHGRVSQHR
ncbi:FtsH Extracellular [Klebsiella pneumoniae]|nr:FtsH Extracellular [Klebsiella pneumoniae]